MTRKGKRGTGGEKRRTRGEKRRTGGEKEKGKMEKEREKEKGKENQVIADRSSWLNRGQNKNVVNNDCHRAYSLVI